MSSLELVVMERSADADIGISEESRQRAAEAVGTLLAGTYALYLKTQYYHWNVVGAEFYNLHVMFEEQYEALREAVDDIAERVRTLGAISPGTFHQFAQLNFVHEDAELPKSWREMVANLSQGHEAVARQCRDFIFELEDTKDEGTIDLMTERMRAHEKTAWMLRSLLRNHLTE